MGNIAPCCESKGQILCGGKAAVVHASCRRNVLWGRPSTKSKKIGTDEAATVTVHIYDVNWCKTMQPANKVLRMLGTGIFHCGVEVHDREWGYYQDVGILCCPPRMSPGNTYVESAQMGKTHMSELEVLALLDILETKDWLSFSYDLLEHNCCHFADAFCRDMGVGNIPYWVSNLATTGAQVRDVLGKCGCCSANARPNSPVRAEVAAPEPCIPVDREVQPDPEVDVADPAQLQAAEAQESQPGFGGRVVRRGATASST